MSNLEITQDKKTDKENRKLFAGARLFLIAGAYGSQAAFLLLAPLWGVRPAIRSAILLLIFQVIFWTMYLTGKNAKNRSLRRMGMGSTAAIFVVISIAAFPLSASYEQELYSLVFEAEGYLYRAASRISGRAENLIAGGQVSGGNIYRTGTEHLELTVSDQPTETLYLRGFSGGEYIGGEWTDAGDEELFTNMARTMNWQEWENMIGSMYYSLYFVMNSNTQKVEEMEPLVLNIRHLNGDYRSAYVPYCSQRDWDWSGEGTYETDGYTYRYYEQSDVAIEWDNVISGFEQPAEWYREVQDAYMDEIQTAYTQVPAQLLPRMTSLVEENPLDSLNEISAFILNTLQNNAAYTLTPGWAPFHEDIAEYFLFESGQGYCEHFASTGTLLYRLYGVPARYAAGYMVSPADFELQENGTWRAVATDENAHAWVEIFLENYGWTPVEVTPAQDGSMVAEYPGFESFEWNLLSDEKKWNRNTWDRNFSYNWQIDLEKYEIPLWVTGAVLLYSLFLMPVFVDYRRLKHLKRLETMNCRKVFAGYMEMLHFAGCLREYDGSEKEFASAVAQRIPVTSLQEIIRIQNIVYKAAYSRETPEEEEEEFVRNIYFRTGKYIYGILNRKQKIIFRYWRMFG